MFPYEERRLQGDRRSDIHFLVTNRMNRVVVAAHFCLFLTLLIVVWALPSGRFVLVVTDPSAPPAHMLSVIGDAGGAFVGPGRLPWMAIAYSDAEGFPTRLMQSGALLVLNHSLAAGCLQRDLK